MMTYVLINHAVDGVHNSVLDSPLSFCLDVKPKMGYAIGGEMRSFAMTKADTDPRGRQEEVSRIFHELMKEPMKKEEPPPEDRVSLTIRLPRDVHALLVQKAKAECRSVTKQIEIMVLRS